MKETLCIRISSAVNHFASLNNPHAGYYRTAIGMMNPTESSKKCKKVLPKNKNLINSPKQ
jgi:hypothetical protein